MNLSAPFIRRPIATSLLMLGILAGLGATLTLPEGTTFLQGSRRTKLPRLAGSGGKTERTWLVRIPGELSKSMTLSSEGVIG